RVFAERLRRSLTSVGLKKRQFEHTKPFAIDLYPTIGPPAHECPDIFSDFRSLGGVRKSASRRSQRVKNTTMRDGGPPRARAGVCLGGHLWDGARFWVCSVWVCSFSEGINAATRDGRVAGRCGSHCQTFFAQ
ncbi:MAG: hypothetical protein ACTHM6_12205, partial [Tepidisphaeraceae bacterium]